MRIEARCAERVIVVVQTGHSGCLQSDNPVGAIIIIITTTSLHTYNRMRSIVVVVVVDDDLVVLLGCQFLDLLFMSLRSLLLLLLLFLDCLLLEFEFGTTLSYPAERLSKLEMQSKRKTKKKWVVVVVKE